MRAALTVLVVAMVAGCDGAGGRTEALKVHYAELEDQYISGGFMRRDRAAPDAAFSNADLVRNFELIALHTEFDDSKHDLVAQQTAVRLSRWEGPIKVSLLGRGVRPSDGMVLRSLTERLEAASGIAFEIVPQEDANLLILMYGAEQRDGFSAGVASGPNAEQNQYFAGWSHSDWSPCIAVTYQTDEAKPGVTTSALIIIKDETDGLLRESCFHEELTQAMGLLNDHPDVRPSLFNDDEEFALLTEHDEFLLRILYHPTLKPNMNADDVRPLLQGIVEDLRPGA